MSHLQMPIQETDQIDRENSFDEIIEESYIEINKYDQRTLKAIPIETPIGLMIAVSDEKQLYVLKFIEVQKLKHMLSVLQIDMHSTILTEKNAVLMSIEKELAAYFSGDLKSFKTPFKAIGKAFQKSAWEILLQIPYAKTISYLDQAKLLDRPTAHRAAASVNRQNPISIVIPCHRVINNNGDLGGYDAGTEKKEWLIKHEQHFDAL